MLNSNYLKKLCPVCFLLLVCMFSSCGKGVKVAWQPVPSGEEGHVGTLKVYLENSGSMDGYMCTGAELKDAVYGYVSALAGYSDTTELNYINSMVIPHKSNLQTFIRNLTPEKFRTVGGVRKNSDLGDMLVRMLGTLKPSDVAVFVSDCILDVPEGNAQDFFVNRQIDIRNAILKQRKKDPEFAVEIICMESKFEGNYYGSDGTTKLEGEKRPYYMWLMGSRSALALLNSKVTLKEIPHGYKYYCAYTPKAVVPFSITNKFGKDGVNAKGKEKDEKEIALKTSKKGKYLVQMKADMSQTLQDDSYLQDLKNYQTSNAFLQLESIAPFKGDEDYTHQLTFTIDKNRFKSAAEQMVLRYPHDVKWVEMMNDDTGKNIKGNLSKTSGIKYLVMGVADAYKDEKQLAEIIFKIIK